MKKFSVMALVAIAAATTFVGCKNGSPKADLKSDIDTLSYAIGMAQTNGLKEYMSQRLGVDTAYIDEFIKGVNEGAAAGDDKKKAAYLAGLQIGMQVGQQIIPGVSNEVFNGDSTKTISMKNFMAGFNAGISGKNGVMTQEEANITAQRMMEQIKMKNMAEAFGPNKAKGEKFLAENAKKADVKTLAKGVQYKVIKEGNGEIPADSSVVIVHYEGRTVDGEVFDSSYKRGEPTEFPANRVIPGWTEALTHMPVGSVWEVYIPQDQAYGQNGAGDQIKPFSALIFKIELLGIKK